MKKFLIIACCLAVFALAVVVRWKVGKCTSPYPWEGPLRLPEGLITQVEIRNYPQFGGPLFQRISTNVFAAQHLVSIVNRAPFHEYHWCGCLGTIKLTYANGKQIKFGYNIGHDPSEYEIVKTSESADGELDIRSYSGVPRVEFFATMRQLGVDDSISGRALPNSLNEFLEYNDRLKSAP